MGMDKEGVLVFTIDGSGLDREEGVEICGDNTVEEFVPDKS